MASQDDSSPDEGIFTFGMPEAAPPMQPPQPNIRRLGQRTRRFRSRSRSSHRGINASPSPQRSPRERPVSSQERRSASSRTPQSHRRPSRSRSRRSRSVEVVGVAQSSSNATGKQIGTCGICGFALWDTERRYKKCMQHYSCGANNAALQDKFKTEHTVPVVLFKSLFYFVVLIVVLILVFCVGWLLRRK